MTTTPQEPIKIRKPRKPRAPSTGVKHGSTDADIEKFAILVKDAIAEVVKGKSADTTDPLSEAWRLRLRTVARERSALVESRVRNGNQLISACRNNRGLAPVAGRTLEDMEQEMSTSFLASYLKSYKTIADGVVNGIITNREMEAAVSPDELLLTRRFLRTEQSEKEFDKLVSTMVTEHPMWEQFFKGIPGVGPWAAAVMLTELDITKANTPSSIHKYAGLDVVDTAYTVDGNGKKRYLSALEAETFEYPELLKWEKLGRTRNSYHLVRVTYDTGLRDDEGKPIFKTRDGITYNPHLKKVLLGVVWGNMVKAKRIVVDNMQMGSAARLALAKKAGYDPKLHGASSLAILRFLEKMGHQVNVISSKYLEHYEGKKQALQAKNLSGGKGDKLTAHQLKQLMRHPIKLLLTDFYRVYRTLLGLPVAVPYAERILGRPHHQSADEAREEDIARHIASDTELDRFNGNLFDDIE